MKENGSWRYRVVLKAPNTYAEDSKDRVFV